MATILFFDDWALQNRDNLERKMGKPQWIPEATLEDDLTEGTWNFPTVWKDRETGKWKAIYCGAAEYLDQDKLEFLQRNVSFLSRDGFGVVHESRRFTSRTQVLLYAESDDGIHWEKPDLTKEIEIAGRYRSNQVFMGDVHINGAPLLYDVHEADPQKRLKYIFTYGDMGRSEQKLATSPDGIRWTVEQGNWGTRYHLDSPITLYYNTQRQSYVISNRLQLGDRRVAIMETKDFQEFSEPELIIHPDPNDPPLVQFYGMPIYPYEDMYIGLLWRLFTDPAEIGQVKLYGPMDCSLTYSYTGVHFNRTFYEPFIDKNERGEHGGGCIYTSSMVEDGDIVRFYSGGSKAEHFRDQTLNDGGLLLHTLRRDGFMYLESYATQGRAITKGIILEEPDLSFNVKVPFGSARAQLRDLNGEPIPGFTLADCTPFAGDEIYWQPKWEEANLSQVLGRQLFVEVEVTEGNLYAIRGTFRKGPRW